MTEITIEQLTIRAYHGVHTAESSTGADFSVDIRLTTSDDNARFTDVLTDTVDYSAIVSLIKQCMAVRSNLLEHVAQRCIDAILARFSSITLLEIKLCKLHPPVSSQVQAVCVKLSWSASTLPERK
ncbi:MAG: dihydroneopterin aldolase [Flavobacteriales bacterium]|nr:dihydroneopterin aldolase [Flavobacteriales bacterium]